MSVVRSAAGVAGDSTGTICSQVTCTLLLVCEGRSLFVGTSGDGRPLVYTTEIVAAGDGTGTWIARILTR